MRLQVQCEDRQGLVGELLELLVKRDINLHGIEISGQSQITLRVNALGFEQFSALMGEIRRTEGVTDVRRVNAMPSEHLQQTLATLINALPDPVLCSDHKGRVELANASAQQLFGLHQADLRQHSLAHLLPLSSEFSLTGNASQPQAIRIAGHLFTLQCYPRSLPEDESEPNQVSGLVVMLKAQQPAGRVNTPPTSTYPQAFDALVAESAKMRQVVNRAKKLAMYQAPLLIVGETGTGKDLLARACHQYSGRRDKPFLALNCASLPDDVAESELFGHAAGAYLNTQVSQKGFFEQAAGGTVYLDEIGEMSPQMQAKLLRFLNDGTFRRVGEEQEVHVDVRVICATQKNLHALVDQGSFREDLFYRLNVLNLQLPALREHSQDLLPLANYFVAKFAEEQGIKTPRISPALASHLQHYHWPGNIRQLKNCLYLAMTQFEGEELRAQDVVLPGSIPPTMVNDAQLEGTLDEISGRFERSVLTRLYSSYPSTRKLAARLGVSHTAIANKLREYGLGQKSSSE